MQKQTESIEQARPRVIAYCRVAQKDHVALEYQRTRLLNYCEEQGYEVVLTICETASGTAERNLLRRLFHCPRRQGLLIMKQAARKKTADGVVATTVSRYSRNTAALVDFVKVLNHRGLFVETTQEGRLNETMSLLSAFA